MHEEILIEMLRTERELRARVLARIAARQLGEAFEPEVEHRAHEIALPLPSHPEPAQS